MAGRDYKVGLDYFELDCHMEEKVKLIQAEYGLKGFAVVVKLYQKIYGGFGYYCEWSGDSLLLFMSENGVPSDSKNLIQQIVAACIRRNIFSEQLFNKFGILTSSGVQKRYLNATSKRGKVELVKEYLLISVGENNKNVVINSKKKKKNAISDSGNRQRKEKKSKEEKNTMCRADALALFERLWQMYPVKKGKGQVSDAQKMKLLKIGFDEMGRAVRRYADGLKRDDWRHPQNGSTFFNSGYVDYLDANYASDKRTANRQAKTQFSQFPQREYDYAELERELLKG